MWRHIGRSAIKLVIWGSLSALALLYALGYHVNWETKAFQQTGSVALRSANGMNDVTVKVDGQTAATSLPTVVSQLFPGLYTIRIEKPGYTTWERLVDVDANKVTSYPAIFLYENKLQAEPLSADDLSALQDYKADTGNILLKDGNALYLKYGSEEQYVNRFSEDILSAQWFPGHKVMMLQVGSDVDLLEEGPNGFHFNSTLLTLPDASPAILMILDGGRRLVLSQGTLQQSYTLYQ